MKPTGLSLSTVQAEDINCRLWITIKEIMV